MDFRVTVFVHVVAADPTMIAVVMIVGMTVCMMVVPVMAVGMSVQHGVRTVIQGCM